MKIRTKLIIGFLAVALVIGIIGYFGFVSIRAVEKSFENVQKKYSPTAFALIEMKSDARKVSIKAMEYALRGEKNDRQKALDASKDLEKHFAAYRKLADLDISEIEKNVAVFKSVIGEYLELKDHRESLRKLMEEEEKVHIARKNLIYNLYARIDIELSELKNEEAKVNKAIALTIWTTFIAVSFILLLAIGIGYYVSRTIINPVIKLRDAATEIGKGKLDTKLEIKSKDELGDLAKSFNQMMVDLKKLTEAEKKAASAAVAADAERKKATEIEKAYAELEKFSKVSVGRELEMVKLKEEIDALLAELGRPKKYEG